MPPIPGSTEDVSSTSSEVNEQDVANQDTANSGEHETAADSSPAADGKEAVSEKDWDPLSIVKKAIEKDPADSEGADGDQGKQSDKSSESEKGSQKAEGASEELGEITEDELKSYKPQTRKRIEGLLDERQRLRDHVKDLEPAAEQMETLQNFMQERSLTPANVSELLVIGGMAMSDDPKDLRAALQRVDAFRTQIMGQLGDVLPEDLQKKVDDGLMDAEGAKEVALARVNNQRADVKVKTADNVVQNANKQVETTNNTVAKQQVHSTITDWHAQKSKSDPDYSRKDELLRKELKLRIMAEPGGVVLDPKRALTIANEAYAEIDRVYKAIAPTNPQAKRVVQSKSNQTSMASRPASALDAARAALQK